MLYFYTCMYLYMHVFVYICIYMYVYILTLLINNLERFMKVIPFHV